MVEGGRDGRDGGTTRRRFLRALGTVGGLSVVGDRPTGRPAGHRSGGSSTVWWAADADVKAAWEDVAPLAYDAGLPPDVEVEVLAGPSLADDRRAQHREWLAAGRGRPDLLLMDAGWTPAFVADDRARSLSGALPPWLERGVRDALPASVAAVTGGDGDLYGVPASADAMVVQYRRDLLETTGYDPSGRTEGQPTWRRFAAAVADARDRTGVEHGFTFPAAPREGLRCAFAAFAGGGTPAGGDRPPADALRMARAFVHGPDADGAMAGHPAITPRDALRWSGADAREPFAAGEAVAHLGWAGSIPELGAADALGDDLGVTLLPGPGAGPAAVLGGRNHVVNPNAASPDAAIEVLSALSREPVRLALFERLGWLPPEPSLLASGRAARTPVVGRYADRLAAAARRAVPRCAGAGGSRAAGSVARRLNAALRLDGDPAVEAAKLAGGLGETEESA